jgi:quaternary ammonium compound-resistance protein SugE
MKLLNWVFLLSASTFEIAWTYSLKYMDVKKILGTNVKLYFEDVNNLKIIAPLIGYIVFGVANIICLSYAMKGIPTSVAFAIWMATVLIGLKLVDTIVLKVPLHITDIICFAFIIVGIIGLKKAV